MERTGRPTYVAAAFVLLALAACSPRTGASASAAASGPTPPAAAAGTKSGSNSTTEPDPCAGAQTPTDMNSCADNEYQGADQKLNAIYSSFKPVSDKLRESERAWIKYRDAECVFAGDYVEGGSMQPMVVSNCMTALTKDRIQTLKGDAADLNQ
jgi:uncharacterized protein YecT (DUF1311 family)